MQARCREMEGLQVPRVQIFFLSTNRSTGLKPANPGQMSSGLKPANPGQMNSGLKPVFPGQTSMATRMRAVEL